MLCSLWVNIVLQGCLFCWRTFYVQCQPFSSFPVTLINNISSSCQQKIQFIQHYVSLKLICCCKLVARNAISWRQGCTAAVTTLHHEVWTKDPEANILPLGLRTTAFLTDLLWLSHKYLWYMLLVRSDIFAEHHLILKCRHRWHGYRLLVELVTIWRKVRWSTSDIP